jgi:DNA gyrase subunit B
MSNTSPRYDESAIRRLSIVEHIRLRPEMYIGGIELAGLRAVIFNVMNVAVELALEGNCAQITITLYDAAKVKIEDYSTGFPVDNIEPLEISRLEYAMTQAGQSAIHAGKYEVQGGMGHLDLLCASALSADMLAEVRRDGYLWRQRYSAGVAQSPLEHVRPLAPDEATGNTFTFTPDFTILEPNEFDYDTLAHRCREIAYSVAGLRLTLRDERRGTVREESFHAPDGLRSLVAHVNGLHTPLHPIIYGQGRETLIRKSGFSNANPHHVPHYEFAFQFIEEPNSNIFGFINSVQTTHEGTHVYGMLKGIAQVLNELRGDDKEPPLTRHDILPGLTAAVRLLHEFPAFESTMKVRLVNPELDELMREKVSAAFATFASEQPHLLRQILQHVRYWRRERS